MDIPKGIEFAIRQEAPVKNSAERGSGAACKKSAVESVVPDWVRESVAKSLIGNEKSCGPTVSSSKAFFSAISGLTGLDGNCLLRLDSA